MQTISRLGLRIALIVALLATALAGSPTAVAGPEPIGGADPDLAITWGQNDLLLALTLPVYTIDAIERDGVAFHQIFVDDDRWSTNGQAGAPAAPERYVLLAVPPAGEITVDILPAQSQIIATQVMLAPVPTETFERQAVQTHWRVDRLAYARNEWLPRPQAEITQEGWLRGHRFVRLALRPFQYNPHSGELRASPQLKVRLRFSETTARPAPADPLFDPVFVAAFPNYVQARGWQQRPEPVQAPRAALERLHSDDPWVKITVDADALYQVTYDDLAGNGVLTSTLDALDPQTFRLLDEGNELRIEVIGEQDGSFDAADAILFYGQRNRAPLSDDNNVTWLTWGGAPGLRMVRPDATPGDAAFAELLLATAHVEQNLQYVASRPFVDWLQPVPYDNWYWSWVTNTPLVVSFEDLNADTHSTAAPALSVWMAGYRALPGDYRVSFALNASSSVFRDWTETQVLTGTVALPVGALAHGDNTLALWPVNVSGLPNLDYTVYLDWLELSYPYSGTYTSGVVFSSPEAGDWRYRITGAPSDEPWVLDLADAMAPQLLAGVTATPSAGGYTLEWQQATTPADRYLVVPGDALRTPGAVEVAVDAGLLATDQQVDYLIIGHEFLLPSIQPLADMRSTVDGYAVRVVDARDVYDTFADGSLSAQAIKDYLAYVYANYQPPAPAFVLLVGDGTVDFRGYKFGLYGHASLMPPFVGAFDPWLGVSISDNAYTLLQGDDLLGEMIISRLPVNSPVEAQVVVDKILDYAESFPIGRLLNTLWVTDNPDNDNPGYGTQFHLASEETLQQLQPGFQVDRVYYCNPSVNVCPPQPWYYTDVSTARTAIRDKFSQGHVLVHYTGHGSITSWASEVLFSSHPSYVDPLSNGPALPFLLTAACQNGYYASPQSNGIDEVLLRTAGKGTIGGLTGTVENTLAPQTRLMVRFVDAVMHEGMTQTGIAAAVARARMVAEMPSPFNEYTALGHNLSGDPALVLVRPEACARGDLDCDGATDIVDVQRVAAAWGTSAWGVGFNPRADLVPDGHIDVADLVEVVGLWNAPQVRRGT